MALDSPIVNWPMPRFPGRVAEPEGDVAVVSAVPVASAQSPSVDGADGPAPDGAEQGWRRLLASSAALVAFFLVAGLYLHPIWKTWRDHLVPNLGDPLFNLYLLKWVGHEAGRRFAGFWDAPFFYPARG